MHSTVTNSTALLLTGRRSQPENRSICCSWHASQMEINRTCVFQNVLYMLKCVPGCLIHRACRVFFTDEVCYMMCFICCNVFHLPSFVSLFFSYCHMYTLSNGHTRCDSNKTDKNERCQSLICKETIPFSLKAFASFMEIQ